MPRRIMDGYNPSQPMISKDKMLNPYIELVVLSHQSVIQKMPIDLPQVSQSPCPKDTHILAA